MHFQTRVIIAAASYPAKVSIDTTSRDAQSTLRRTGSTHARITPSRHARFSRARLSWAAWVASRLYK